MTDVVMPQMGESIVEGTLTKWLKKTGDRISPKQFWEVVRHGYHWLAFFTSERQIIPAEPTKAAYFEDPGHQQHAYPERLRLTPSPPRAAADGVRGPARRAASLRRRR